MNANDLNLIVSSLILLVAGMGVTFVFLIIQVWCTNLSSKITARYSHLLPDPTPKKAPVKAAAKAPAKADDGELVAVISAAIQHRTGK
ncbi:MAG TPA: OadG family protein [Lentisphaeria bacterium]|nr:OadG family protein [Lentisphaeria bacterium]